MSRTATTTPEVMNATAQQDTDSTQTDVAVMVCLTKCGWHSYFNETEYLLLLNLGEFQCDSEDADINIHNVVFVLVSHVK